MENRIKSFLISNSRLLPINAKEESGKTLTECEKKGCESVYEARERAFRKIRNEISKFYEKAVNGNYSYDGMPEINGGIRGWIEAKIWRLLVEIAEPGHLKYKSQEQKDFWKEVE